MRRYSVFGFSEYSEDMDHLDLKRYQEKLVCGGVRLPDPRGIPEGDWKTDLSHLPGHLYQNMGAL